MTRATPEPPRRAALRDALGESSPLRPFAEAVMLHLDRSGAFERDRTLADRAITIFRGVHERRAVSPLVLAESPVLVASFFQNLDLTPPVGDETNRIGLLVAEAMEILVATEG